jgi:hypothetical protein
LSGRHGKKRKHHNKENATATSTEEHIQPSEKPAETKPAETKPDEEPRKPQQKHKRAAMKSKVLRKPDAIEVARWTLVVTAIIAAIYYFQLRSMQESVDLAGKAINIGQRAWLGIDSPRIGQVSNHWSIKFGIKNFGHSPSLHSTVATNIEFAPTEWDTVKKDIQDACTRGEKLTTSGLQSEEHGYTIFPDTSISPQMQTIGQDEGRAVAWMGCISYLDQFANDKGRPIRHTRFCYNTSPPFAEGETPTPCFGGQETD